MENMNDKYHFYFDAANRTVICTTFYKGRIVKATAKCDPSDVFDMETGRELAYLRCRRKFLHQKADRASDAYAKAWAAAKRAEEKFRRTVDFVDDVTCEIAEVNNKLAELEDKLFN